jgi:uncharacterized protein (TIGR04255 family)
MNKMKQEEASHASKISAEIRFRPNLNYFSDAFKIAAVLEPNYEDWQTSHDPYQAVLVSPTAKEVLRIGSDAIVIIIEKSNSYNNLIERLLKVTQLFLASTEISEIRRIGVRQIEVLETQHEFVELATKMTKAFSAPYGKVEAIALDAVVDYAYVLDGIKNGYKNHIRFGPVKDDEAKARFGSLFPEQLRLKSHNGIYLDIDVFNDEVMKVKDVDSNIKNIVKESERITTSYRQLIKEEVR